MEMDTPSGPVDAVYVTATGRLALLEAKLWRNPEARRKVIAQILDYATQIAQWDYTRFDSAVRQARRKSYHDGPALSLAELVIKASPGTPEHLFIDSLSRTLAHGDFLLLVAGDGIREGAGAIAHFIDKYGTLHFGFGLIECAVYGMPDGRRFLQPRVVARTVLIERRFTELRSGAWSEDSVTAASEEDSSVEINPELEKTRQKYQAYWREFLAKVRVEDSQPISKPAMTTNQLFVMPAGSRGWVGAYLSQSRGHAGVYLTFERGGLGERRLFDLLEAQKADIDAALGLKVKWTADSSGRRRVIVSKEFPGELLDKSRAASQEWLADVTQRFVSVFRPRIEALMKELE
jgi:hypothetical protein